MKNTYKFIVTGYKERHCGRMFYYSRDKRWNLMFEGKRVRDIRKTKYVVTKYTREDAKKILSKEYWRYL